MTTLPKIPEKPKLKLLPIVKEVKQTIKGRGGTGSMYLEDLNNLSFSVVKTATVLFVTVVRLILNFWLYFGCTSLACYGLSVRLCALNIILKR